MVKNIWLRWRFQKELPFNIYILRGTISILIGNRCHHHLWPYPIILGLMHFTRKNIQADGVGFEHSTQKNIQDVNIAMFPNLVHRSCKRTHARMWVNMCMYYGRTCCVHRSCLHTCFAIHCKWTNHGFQTPQNTLMSTQLTITHLGFSMNGLECKTFKRVIIDRPGSPIVVK